MLLWMDYIPIKYIKASTKYGIAKEYALKQRSSFYG